MNVSVVILAAGQGTRMKSKLPKVLHEISGKPMLFHAIEAAQKISDDITIVLFHEASMIEAKIKDNYSNINFHIQDAINFPGTGGAMMGVKTKYEKTLILNGDMPLVTNNALHKLIDNDSDITISVIELLDPSGYGRVIIENGEVKHIVEQKDCSEEQLKTKSVNAGVYCVKSSLLQKYIPTLKNNNAQKEYYLTDIIEMAVKDKKHVKPIYVDEEEFKGVNSKLDLSHAEEIMQARIRSHWMREGVIMRLPQTIYIDSRATFEGECIIENGVSIIGNCIIKNSHIKTGSVVENSTVENSDIGPMARIRPDSTVIDTHIGNFVEIKKSNLNGVKAGHLSYIGDASVDEGTNIGAGTITCNYDGKAKYKTVIGKNVFIGSDSQLVAPVTIPDDVMIAAGTTVTKDPNSGDLVISRTMQKSIANFFYKFFGIKK
ncbi:MAG: bifunctional N-acetylglucosamine-1-phosphate uridyltransferase/glucosamine-1-phosphate acetyltransferase [Sulfurovum sp. AS07-7]|nr:MAG: bifunctional N-acetylglucosamine-1-phosphate uridyltransferase/glucosamine-1-phosphate acetyltransferase [Sulfurovum sp. AS07-7]